MIRSTMETWLDRRTDGAWTSSQLVDFLNQGLLKLGQYVSSVDPDFFMRLRRQDLEAGVSHYPRPTDARHVDSVWIKDSTSGLYTPIDKRQRAFIRNRYRASGVSSGGTTVWARVGRYIQIDPAPSSNVSAGLQVWESYLPTMAEDGSEPPLPIDLHQAIVNRAQRLMLPETADFISLADSLDKEYASMIGDWAQGYFETAEPLQLEVDDPGYEAEG